MPQEPRAGVLHIDHEGPRAEGGGVGGVPVGGGGHECGSGRSAAWAVEIGPQPSLDDVEHDVCGGGTLGGEKGWSEHQSIRFKGEQW